MSNSWGDDFHALRGYFRRTDRVSLLKNNPRSPKATIALIASVTFLFGGLVSYALFNSEVPIPLSSPSPSPSATEEVPYAEDLEIPELLESFQELVPGNWESVAVDGCAEALSSTRGETNALVLRRTVGEALSASDYEESITWDGESRIEGFTIRGEREEPRSDVVFTLADDSMTLCVR